MLYFNNSYFFKKKKKKNTVRKQLKWARDDGESLQRAVLEVPEKRCFKKEELILTTRWLKEVKWDKDGKRSMGFNDWPLEGQFE